MRALLRHLLSIVALLLLAAQAGAQDRVPSRILLLVDGDNEGAASRLRAELRALGFEVRERKLSVSAASPAQLEQTAREAGAVAALRLRTSPRGVEVWVGDRVTGKTVLREVVLGAAPTATGRSPQPTTVPLDRDAEIALGAVELLRASLLEIEFDLPSRGEIAVTPEVRKLVAPVVAKRKEVARSPLPPRLWLGFAPAAGISPGGLGVTPHVQLDVDYLPLSRLSLNASIVTPTLPSRVEAAEGSSSTTVGQAGLGTDFVVAALEAPFNARVGLGISLIWVHMDGSAAQPFADKSDDILAALPYLRARVSYGINRSLRLFLGSRVGFCLPRPVIRFAGREVASWGRPAGLAALGIRLALD